MCNVFYKEERERERERELLNRNRAPISLTRIVGLAGMVGGGAQYGFVQQQEHDQRQVVTAMMK